MSNPQIDSQMVSAMRHNAANTLTAAIISTSGRAFSIDEALAVAHDVYNSMYQEPGNGRYAEWKKSFDGSRVIK